MKTPSTSNFSITTVAIRRHIGTLMLTLAVIVIGVFFLFNIQVDLLPSITYPRIGLRLDAPGISPEVLVDEVTRPLEEGLAATEGVVQIFSQTREGGVSVDLYFRPGGNIDRALNDATAAFNRARSNLPDVVRLPRLFKYDPSQLPVYELALTSQTLDPLQLRVFADEELGRELGVVEGVAVVDVSGGVSEEVRVLIDLSRLQALGVGLNEVLTELEDTNRDVSGGRILGDLDEPLTRAIGRFEDAAEILDLSFPVAAAEPQSVPSRVYLRDFAEVSDGRANQRVFVYLNRQPAVKLSIQKQPEANTVEVVAEIKQRLQQLREAGVVPEDMEVVATLDESIFIRNAIGNVVGAGLIGAGLAAIAVLLFLGSLRQTAIVVSAIPLAALTAIILMKLFGLSLNVFSLGGLAVGVGIVVDNSIVMLENIAEGVKIIPSKAGVRSDPQKIIERTIASSQEVESALVASTSTNLVAVVPFLLIGGFIALLFNELVLTVSFAIAASVLIAITVVPMLASRLLAIRKSSSVGRFWLLQAFQRQFEAATRGYAIMLKGVLRRRIIAIALTFLLLGGSSVLIFDRVPQEILPRINTGQARLFARFPPGTPLATNRLVMEKVDEILLAQPETEYVFTTSGGFLFGSNTSENPLRGSSTITLQPNTDVEAYVSRVSAELDKLNLVDTRLGIRPGAVRGLILNNSPIRGDVDVVLQGQDSQTLERAGRQVLDILEQRATLSNFRPDADPRQPEIQIRLDRERAANLDLNIQDLGDTLETAITGSVPTQLQRGNRLIDVRVELEEASISRPSQLKQIPLFTGENNLLIRLRDVANIEQGEAPGEIQRINQRQVFLISGGLEEDADLGAALAELEQIFQDIDLPAGVSRLPSAAAESNQEIQSAFTVLGGLAAFLVFVVMAVQYNSLVDPLVIMFTLPLALAGGIWGLFITQTAIGVTVIVGAVLLVGIVVNNAIILVELANQIRERKRCDRTTAILQAAPKRLRPILMTTITTVVGMFPLALGLGQGGEFLQPLGIVVFSGLALATLLTLFIIPCFYILLHDLVDLIVGKQSNTNS